MFSLKYGGYIKLKHGVSLWEVHNLLGNHIKNQQQCLVINATKKAITVCLYYGKEQNVRNYEGFKEDSSSDELKAI